jgi:hypothetical protein
MSHLGAYLMGLAIGIAVGAFWGYVITTTSWERGAVKHGHATYYLDGNNNRQWKWSEARP